MQHHPIDRRRLCISGAAILAALAILLTGTFAWQSISQTALNEMASQSNHGGRLHDDFNGQNKDIYVENFTAPGNGGVPIYARIRLDEYMEIGPDAGIKRDAPDRDAVPLNSGSRIDDVCTWTTRLPINATDSPDAGFHRYWQWDMGGSTVYMPTFNMNKDSLAAEINGTFAGPDGDPTTREDSYKDYVVYREGQVVTQDEVWDMDSNSEDEGRLSIEGVNISLNRSVQHTARPTLTATVVTMQEWMDMGSPVGPYWVYDADGWAYWADAIRPGEATGLLLDGIYSVNEPEGSWYYAIHVVAQFASAGDWGQDNASGFFDPTQGAAPSANAMTLLNTISGIAP